MFLKTAHGVGTTCDVKLAIKGVPLPVKGWNVNLIGCILRSVLRLNNYIVQTL